MENPLVSVIVVSYNHSRYIRENLDHIKNQTYKNIQLILGDDASPDNSVEVIEQWLKDNNYSAEKNFHTKNTGLAEMLNECVSLAKGKYVKIMAADDYLHPESIESCVDKFESQGDDCGMVFTDYWAIDDDNKPVEFFLNYENKDFFNEDNSLKKDQLVKYNCVIGPSVLLKKEILLLTGKFDTSLILEDHHRWLEINEKKKIYFINKKLVYYRVLPTSVTNTRHERMVEEDLYLRMKYDKNGINKNEIYNSLYSRYQKKVKISSLVRNQYLQYPYKVKRLSFALKYNIPPSLYDIFTKIYNRL